MIIEGDLKDMEEQLTRIEQTEIDILSGFNGARNEESNPEEVHMDDDSIGYESLSANCDSSYSLVKVSTKSIKKTSKKLRTSSVEESSASERDGPKSSTSHFS
jgi:hypothetical protein